MFTWEERDRFVTVTPSGDTGQMKKNPTSYRRHRFPPAIISHAVGTAKLTVAAQQWANEHCCPPV